MALAIMAMGLGRGFRDSYRDRRPEAEASRTVLVPPLDPVLTDHSDLVDSTDSRRLLESMVDAWLEGGRDPFVVEPPIRPEPTPDPLPPLHQFQLSAVWVQPGRRFAVINGQVVQAGDRIGSCTLEKCEPNAVWLANGVASRRLLLQRKPSTSPRFPSP